MGTQTGPHAIDSPAASAILGRLGRLVRKELSEVLRDRRTILTLVLMPVLLYPLLSVAFRQFFVASASGQAEEKKPYRLGFTSEDDQRIITRQLQRGFEARNAQARQVGADKKSPGPKMEAGVWSDLEEAVRDGRAELGIRLTKERATGLPGSDAAYDCLLLRPANSPRADEALRLVEELLAAAQGRDLEARLGIRTGRPVVLLRPRAEVVAELNPGDNFSLAPVIPLILILMTITGAVYPAIDLTAGERERGTLEILMAAPVPRLGLLFAKYVTVVTVAVLTALVNLVSMFVTVELSGLGQQLFPGGLSPLLLLELFGLLLLLAAFFSAVLLIVTSFARSFKEAQAFLIPLMLASLGPGLLGLFPGLKLEWPLMAVPLVNIVLLARDLMQGGAAVDAVAVVIVSTLLYATAAVAVAARLFGAEAVLYKEQSGWSDLWRRPAEPRPAATPGGALLCLALLFPAHFVAQGLLARAQGQAPELRGLVLSLLAMSLLSLLLFAAFPLAVAALRRVRLGSGFLLRPASVTACAGGLLLGLSLWPFVVQLLALMQHAHLTTLDAAQSERMREALERVRAAAHELPLWPFVAVFVVQAVVEELFFRGFLFSALRGTAGPAMTVGVTALLFGLFHLVVTDAFALERLLPSTLLGLVLGWVCWRSGSVLPPMLLHGCHNAVLAVLTYGGIERTGDDSGAEFLPAPWLLMAAAAAAVGLVLLALRPAPVSRNHQAEPASSSRL
jgi:ABC-2 type transport system permease protein/sodium transport system permease protein